MPLPLVLDSVKSLFKVYIYKVVMAVLLMLNVLIYHDVTVKKLLNFATIWSEVSLLFC